MSTDRRAYYRRLQDVHDEAARTREGFYDASAGTRRHRHTVWQRLNRRHITSLLEPLARERSMASFLDVGCGNGDFGVHLRGRLGLPAVHGIDVSPSMVAAGRVLHGVGNRAALSFSVGDVTTGLAFRDRAFDTVCCLNVFHHFLPDDQKAAIGQLCRVARRFVVLEVKRFHVLHRVLTGYRAMGTFRVHAVRIRDVLAQFDEHGFHPVTVRPIFYVRALSPIAVLVLARKEGA